MSRSVRVSIAGCDFSVRTDTEPAYVRKLATYVENIMLDVKTTGPGMSNQILAMMAAMKITDSFLQLQPEPEEVPNDVHESAPHISTPPGHKVQS